MARYDLLDQLTEHFLENPFKGTPDAQTKAESLTAWVSESYGGRRFRFGRRSEDCRAFLDALVAHLQGCEPGLSIEETQAFRAKFLAGFSGNNAYIPHPRLALEKKNAILREIAAGERVKAVAEAFGVTEAWVYKVNSDHRKAMNGGREAHQKPPA